MPVLFHSQHAASGRLFFFFSCRSSQPSLQSNGVHVLRSRTQPISYAASDHTHRDGPELVASALLGTLIAVCAL